MRTVESSNNGRMVRRLTAVPVVFAVVLGLSSLAQAQNDNASAMGMQGAHSDEHQAHAIQGSWNFNIDVLGQGATFHSLISFMSDNVVITSASLPGPSFTPYYGSWRQTGKNRFRAAFYAFLPDASGVGTALSKVSLDVNLTGRNDLAGTAVGLTCDLQGENCVQNVDFQFKGRRIPSE